MTRDEMINCDVNVLLLLWMEEQSHSVTPILSIVDSAFAGSASLVACVLDA